MRRAPEPFGAVFSDEAVDEVLVDGLGRMSVVRSGRSERQRSPFKGRDALAEWLLAAAEETGARLDPLRPATGGRLGGAFRWHAVLSPTAPDGPLLSLRRHRFASLKLAAFAEGSVADALLMAFECGRPLVIAGPTGSGKTSLLAALLAERAAHERVVCLEAFEELPDASPQWVRLVERTPNLEGKGGVTLARLFHESLRLRPDRLVLGEVRGAEARLFAEAALTGHRGVLTTMHAGSRAQVLARLRALVPAELFAELAAELVVVSMRAERPLGVREVS